MKSQNTGNHKIQEITKYRKSPNTGNHKMQEILKYNKSNMQEIIK